ncbi:MAG TPA: hypothetical protein VMW43_07380 [Bacteroidota bacterium]|nr:hypothetical protein [Bacteroidota bacterium]
MILRGRTAVALRLLCVVPLMALLSVSSPGQEKILSRRLPGFPYVSFAYRRVGADSVTGKNRMEWIFVNRTDSTLTFSYRLASGPADTVAGRVTIPPREKCVAGWLFAGDTLRTVDCTDAEFKPSR